MGATWLRHGLRNLMVHVEDVTYLVKSGYNFIVANDELYAVAA